MPRSVVLSIKPAVNGEIGISHGGFCYAAALELLGRKNKQLAKEIHDMAGLKPLVVSPLLVPVKQKTGKILQLCRGSTYRWRLTGLTDSLADALASLAEKGDTLRIGDTTFEVVALALAPRTDNLAKADTYDEIVERCKRRSIAHSYSFHVATPASFKVGQQNMPLPLPSLFWGSLSNTWSRWAEVPLSDMQNIIEKNVVLFNWCGETQFVNLGGHNAVGFTGRFEYRLLEPKEPISFLLNVLAEYAFYAGIGRNRSYGMGQVQLNWIK